MDDLNEKQRQYLALLEEWEAMPVGTELEQQTCVRLDGLWRALSDDDRGGVVDAAEAIMLRVIAKGSN